MDISKSNVSKLMGALLELGGIESGGKVDWLKEAKIVELAAETERNATDSEEYLKIDDFKITFLPLNIRQEFIAKPKFDNFFHIAYFSNTGAVNMTKELTKILRPNSLVLFETAKFMLEMKTEQINSFSERLKQIAAECGLLDLNEKNETNESKAKIEQNDFLIFKYESKTI